MSALVHIKDNREYSRDINTGALVRTDRADLDGYIARKQQIRAAAAQNKELEKRINVLEEVIPQQLEKLRTDINLLVQTISALRTNLRIENDQ